MVRIAHVTAAILLGLASGLPAPVAAQEGCLSGREGREIVASARILPFPVAVQRAGLSPRDVQDVALCRSGGGYVYRVRVVQPNGGARTITIPAN